MLLKKKLFEGNLKHFKRCMMHPDVAFATATNVHGEKFVFICNPERRDRIAGDIIGFRPHVPKAFGFMIFNCNRDIDEHEIRYYTRDAYKVMPGLLYAPEMPGTMGNTNLFSVVLSDLEQEQKIHVHTDTHGDEWFVNRSSFRNRGMMLHYQGHKRKGTFGQEFDTTRWVYADVLDQYSGEWFLENLSKENVAKLLSKKVAQVTTPEELTFEDRCEYIEVAQGGCLIVDRHLKDGIWERQHYDLIINVENMITDKQVINLRTPLAEWVENFRTSLEPHRVYLDIDRCGFRYAGKLISGATLAGLTQKRFYCVDVANPKLLLLPTTRRFPNTPW